MDMAACMGWMSSTLMRRTEEHLLAVVEMSSESEGERPPPPPCLVANPASLERARERWEGRREGPNWSTRLER